MIARVVWAAVLGALNELDSKPRSPQPQPQVVVVPVVIQPPAPPTHAALDALIDDLTAIDDDEDEGCGCTPARPDGPRHVTHQLPAEGLWHLLVRAARHAKNGETVEDAAHLVMAELDLEHTEATADTDPEDP